MKESNAELQTLVTKLKEENQNIDEEVLVFGNVEIS